MPTAESNQRIHVIVGHRLLISVLIAGGGQSDEMLSAAYGLYPGQGQALSGSNKC